MQNKDLETANYGITSTVAQDFIMAKYPEAKMSMFLAAAHAILALQSSKIDYVMTTRASGDEFNPFLELVD